MLTPRLDTVAKYIYTKTAADIGTDHAYIPIHIVKNKIAEHVIATDLRKGPLLIAESNVKKNGLSDNIELRLGNGLAPVENYEAETFVIAGMGGELISDILENDIKKAKKAEYLVLQPMNSQDALRKWLSENGFSVLKEDIATEEYKVYNIILARKGTPVIYKNEFELHIPPYLYSNKYFYALRDKKKREFLKIKNGLEAAAAKNEELIEKYSGFLNELDKL